MARKQVSFEESDQLNFMDFIPECLETGGFIRKPVYENFQTLVYKANRWLKSQQDVVVISIQVLEIPCKANIQGYPAKPVDCENPYFELVVMSDTGLVINPYIHVMRLWYCRDGAKGKQPLVIEYMNFVPNCLEAGGLFKSAKFESMVDMKEKIKEQLKKTPISGIIVDVQTYSIRFQNWKDVHPDCAFYSGCDAAYSVQALRVFFIKSSCPTLELDFIDFCPRLQVPDQKQKDKMIWESFRSLYSRVTEWFNDQCNITIFNFQTICHMNNTLPKDGNIDTTKSFSKLNTPINIIYYIRVYFSHKSVKCYNSQILPNITKTAIPCAVSKASTFKPGKFESMSGAARRLGSWCDGLSSHVQVVGVETLPIPLRPKDDPVCDVSTTYHFCKVGICPIQWVYSIRVYVRREADTKTDQDVVDATVIPFSAS